MALKVALLTLMLASHAFGQEDDLGEAAGLSATTPLPKDTPPRDKSQLRWRAYGILDGRWQRTRDGVVKSSPNGEIGAALDHPIPLSGTVFLEGRGLYKEEEDQSLGIIDQGGLRIRPTEKTVVVLGKERNRRSPGLILSPSDFLHTSQNIPGLREERSGVWLARLAWQTETQSADLIALPVSKQGESGLPAKEAHYAGTAVRYFSRLPGGVDLGIDAGSFEGEGKLGLFLQTIAANVWKLYGEAGFDEKTTSSSHLLGLGYEASSTYTVRVEWYGRDAAWLPPSPLFSDESYAIVSVSGIDLLDRFNLSDTVVRSLATETYLNLLRGEWLFSDRQVGGITLMSLQPDRPLRWQGIVDWKLSL